MAIDVGRTSSISEGELMHGYQYDPAVLALKAAGPRMERRPCACRGIVTAEVNDPMPGVQTHNATTHHLAWRAQRA